MLAYLPAVSGFAFQVLEDFPTGFVTMEQLFRHLLFIKGFHDRLKQRAKPLHTVCQHTRRHWQAMLFKAGDDSKPLIQWLNELLSNLTSPPAGDVRLNRLEVAENY